MVWRSILAGIGLSLALASPTGAYELLKDCPIPVECTKRRSNPALEEQLLKMTGPHGEPLFSETGVCRVINSGATLEYIQTLLSIVDQNCHQRFNCHLDLIEAYDSKLDPDYLKTLAEKTTLEGTPLYYTGQDLVNAAKAKVKVDAQKIEALAAIPADPGKSYFRNIRQIHNALAEDLTVKEVQELRAVGIFEDPEWLIKYKEAKGTVAEAQEFAKAGFDGKDTYRFKQLGISLSEALRFTDTPKPNALLIYPFSDTDGFEGRSEINLYHKLKEAYDVRFIVARQEEDLYREMARMRTIDFLMIGGHGTKITVGFTDANLKDPTKERFHLDIGDLELQRYRQYLAPDAIIFLNSCKNGADRDSHNMANFVYEQLDRTVISSTRSFRGDEMIIDSIKPFAVRIVNFTDNIGVKEDVTYTIQKR